MSTPPMESSNGENLLYGEYNNETEELMMQYAASHGRMSADDKARITDAALERIDAIEAYAQRKAKRKLIGWLPIGILGSLAIGAGIFLWLPSPSSTPVTSAVLSSTPAEEVARQAKNDFNIVSDPSSRHWRLEGKLFADGMRAQIFWNELTNVMFIDRSGLPTAPAGEVYTVWTTANDGTKTRVGEVKNTENATPLIKVGCEAQAPKIEILKAPSSQAGTYNAAHVVFESSR